MISIIIPTHNRAHLISRAIQSVIDQSYTDWELIIVDDGSTDNTEEVLQPFLKDERIRYIIKENSGAAHSRNVGVDLSTGDYITFLDSDDEAKPEWLFEIMQVIENEFPVLICCGCEIVSHQGEIVDIKLPESKKELFGDVDYKMTNGGVFIMPREVFEKVGGFDNNLKSGQHTELSFRLLPYILNSGGKIINIYKPLIKVHIHKGERIRGNPEMKFQGTEYCLTKHAKFFNDKKAFRSNYEGTLGRNAYLTRRKNISIKYFWKAFKSNPSIKRFGRLLIYTFRNYLG